MLLLLLSLLCLSVSSADKYQCYNRTNHPIDVNRDREFASRCGWHMPIHIVQYPPKSPSDGKLNCSSYEEAQDALPRENGRPVDDDHHSSLTMWDGRLSLWCYCAGSLCNVKGGAKSCFLDTVEKKLVDPGGLYGELQQATACLRGEKIESTGNQVIPENYQCYNESNQPVAVNYTARYENRCGYSMSMHYTFDHGGINSEEKLICSSYKEEQAVIGYYWGDTDDHYATQHTSDGLGHSLVEIQTHSTKTSLSCTCAGSLCNVKGGGKACFLDAVEKGLIRNYAHKSEFDETLACLGADKSGSAGNQASHERHSTSIILCGLCMIYALVNY